MIIYLYFISILKKGDFIMVAEQIYGVYIPAVTFIGIGF
ncbi:hypothetical protein GMMP15_1220002 [Candidatus Magnetomoraceae bacterium gMMP-15]